ncbi:interactor of constitutive active ROPs 2, chloroplastic [Zingiber officinale]|uniref:interactor of constitutive active ROPs 2, chloroplastic n=1 Tax=Zingiber officinale TaxID=94328 RepID=UPI001C4D0618|nr:interactor of constitutive active ROPs 2, chloroplastic [Zingiber officinale]
MQTGKPSRPGSLEVPHNKTSPITPRTRVSKSGDRECNSTSSTATSATSTRTPTDRSPKVLVRRSPRSPVSERKHPTRLSELESQFCQIQLDLKKTREQLNSSEICKKQAQQEVEEAKKQLQEMTGKLDNSQRQLVEFSAAEEARLHELRKISQERDRAWQSELEAIQKQHSIDSTALGSAMIEIQKLKGQLEMVLKSEASQLKQSELACSELQTLKQDMEETLLIVENLKIQLKDSKKLEAEAWALVDETRGQLEMAKTTIETLRCERLKLQTSFRSKVEDLEESRVEDSMQNVLKTLYKDTSLESEVEQLKSALESIEIKYQAEQIKSTIQIQTVYEVIERGRSEFELKEAELEQSLKKAKAEITELKSKLMEKEAEYQKLADQKEMNIANGEAQKAQVLHELELKLLKSSNEIADLKVNLIDKETELQNILEENEILRSDLSNREAENRNNYEATIAELELAKAAEQDALIRLGCVTEESDKNSRRAARVAEQLNAAQTVNSEMESELKRLRIQCDQWRKAAEAATSILASENNGSHMERTGSLEGDYGSIAGKLMSSPFSDELEEESPKKKNSNVLRKIGGFWKKSPK